jgi:hypothetical protein
MSSSSDKLAEARRLRDEKLARSRASSSSVSSTRRLGTTRTHSPAKGSPGVGSTAPELTLSSVSPSSSVRGGVSPSPSVAEMFASSLDRTERKFRELLPTASPGYRPVVGGSDDDDDGSELGRGTGLSRQQARDGGKVGVGAASPSQVAASLGAGSKGGGDGSSGPATTDLEGGGGRGGAYVGRHDPRPRALPFPLAQPQPEPEGGEKEEAGPAGAGALMVTFAESRPSPLRDRVACCRVDGSEGAEESSGGEGGGDAQARKAVVASDGTKMLPPPPWFREGGWRLRACEQATPASVFIVAGGICFIVPLLVRSNCHFRGPHQRHARLTAVCFAFGVAICWGCVVHVTRALPKLLRVDDLCKGPLYKIGRRPSGKPQLLSPEALQTLGRLNTSSHLICLAMAAWFVGLVRWCFGTRHHHPVVLATVRLEFPPERSESQHGFGVI